MDFKGAPASNAGDDYHELWVTRQAIRLLDANSDLTAIAVEGVSLPDAAGEPPSTWSGVDCTLYFGGTTASDANRVEIVQIKYSTTHPQRAWTVSRLVEGGKRRSVLSKLAKAWKAIAKHRPTDARTLVTLVSNQPVHRNLAHAVQRMATTNAPPAGDTPEGCLARVAGLGTQELRAFASSLSFKCGAGSRLALEEDVLRSISDWTDSHLRHVVTNLQDFVRRKMMPDTKGELITRESVLVRLGVSDESALFPCPSAIEPAKTPVLRAAVREAARKLQKQQYICLHGQAGVGKTTALQEIASTLPDGSIMLKYDCYGAGRYLDPSALRHRTKDAFLQLTNELAVALRLPFFLLPPSDTDYPRQFMKRLRHAAATLHGKNPAGFVVVAVDAADNAVVAGRQEQPTERSFTHDFVRLADLPPNVRFVVTARTGRLHYLGLPPNYLKIEVKPFEQEETRRYVDRKWPSAPHSWVEDFHHYSNGIPRVQDIVFAAAAGKPSDALQRLLPGGKSLEAIFKERFRAAIQKADAESTLTKFCAALIALPRPVPLSALAHILEETEPQIVDICQDLAPSIRHHDGQIGFADEDLEEFVRNVGADDLADVRVRVARLMLDNKDEDRYAALNVASALRSANLRAELLHLVKAQPVPPAHLLSDPILRREVELQRLGLAMAVCREAGNVSQALRFVLMGVESIRTEAALHQLLTNNPDLAVRFAEESVRRLIMSEPRFIQDQGAFLFHGLAVDAELGETISERERRRKLTGWLEARQSARDSQKPGPSLWDIGIDEISAAAEATLKLRGPLAMIEELQRWRPRSVRLRVDLRLPWRLAAEGSGKKLEALARELNPVESLFVLVPLGLSGQSIDADRLAAGIEAMAKRIDYRRLTGSPGMKPTITEEVIRLMLNAIEVLVAKSGPNSLIDGILATVIEELSNIEIHSAYEVSKLDILLRAYTLREVIHGRTPAFDGVFASRAKAERDESLFARDRRVEDVAKAALDLYATVAGAVVADAPAVDLDRALADFFIQRWVFSYYGSYGFTGFMGAHLSLLLLAGYDPSGVWKVALRVHDDWRDGRAAPNDAFLARFSLWPSLHECSVRDVGAAAQKTRCARMAAQEKVDILIRHARSLVPISPPDAEAIFGMAADVVGELDVETMDFVELVGSLVEHCGRQVFHCPQQTAVRFANVLADAAVRLDGYRHFPWSAAMACLARLDVPLALASVGRWSDEDVATISKTLPPVLREGLRTKAIEPQQVAALGLFLDDDPKIFRAILQSASAQLLGPLSEEIAYNLLVRQVGDPNDVLPCLEAAPAGIWTSALRRQQNFLSTLPPEGAAAALNDTHNAPERAPVGHQWTLAELVDVEKLDGVIFGLMEAHKDWPLSHVGRVLDSARPHVPPAMRVNHICALAKLECGGPMSGEVARAIRDALVAWAESPSVATWAEAELPELIVARFGDFTSYLRLSDPLPRSDPLSVALKFANMSAENGNDTILRGIEATAGALTSRGILALVDLVACNLRPRDTAELVDWYVERLERRVPNECRDQTTAPSQIPTTVNEAVGRFLFSHFGDCDLRLRWKAAHAVRLLARTNDGGTIGALIEQYSRREDRLFRAPNCPFYWLAARLWFAIALDAMARECPSVAAHAADQLLRIALDDSLPHVLIRAFARDACEKLQKKGLLSLTDEQQGALNIVNETTLAKSARKSGGWPRRGFSARTDERRFEFSRMDTLPYWYEPLLQAFANVKLDEFLTVVERWIVDECRIDGDVRKLEEGRENRFSSYLQLTDNRHGTMPTLERLEKYLEWHAMWCAVGELLKVEALSNDPGDSLLEAVARHKLASPPNWSADFAGPIPLEARFWRSDGNRLEPWLAKVDEGAHLSAMLPQDPLDHVVVYGYWTRRMVDRMEFVHVRSALVAPRTASSLVRAWRTMGDSWDYVVPSEENLVGDDIDHAAFRLLGWLRKANIDDSCGADGKDPFKAYGMGVQVSPGRCVTKECGLVVQNERGRYWWNGQTDAPMFVYQAWGKAEEDETAVVGLSSSGYRLLAQRGQLRTFLCESGWKLIVDVEITRRDRRHERRRAVDDLGEGVKRCTNVYLLGSDGRVETSADVLGLGQAIVEELGLPPHAALERWMAHHLASILEEMDQTNDGDRSTLEDDAVALVLRLWAGAGDRPSKDVSTKLVNAASEGLRRFVGRWLKVASQGHEVSRDRQRVQKSLSALLVRMQDTSANKRTAR